MSIQNRIKLSCIKLSKLSIILGFSSHHLPHLVRKENLSLMELRELDKALTAHIRQVIEIREAIRWKIINENRNRVTTEFIEVCKEGEIKERENKDFINTHAEYLEICKNDEPGRVVILREQDVVSK